MKSKAWLLLSALSLASGAAYGSGGELTHYETSSVNDIGEEVLDFNVLKDGREFFRLMIPVTQIDLPQWRMHQRIHLDWTSCKTQEMLTGNGELTQCIRRAQLALLGESDLLAPATLDVEKLPSGELVVAYQPVGVPIAKPMHFTAALRSLGISYRLPTMRDGEGSSQTAGPLDQAEDVLASAQPTKFIFFGDAGTGDRHQYDVARGIAAYCTSDPSRCGFVVMLGDNFYRTGVDDTADRQWQTKFEKPYGALGLDFYPVLGNHDHYGNIQAQLDYAKISPQWKMPARYYHFDKGDVAFFGIDSDDYDIDQRRWLSASLKASTKSWKIVFAHHPVYSFGVHGNSRRLAITLLPLLQEAGVDFYLAGHDHVKQVIEKDHFNNIVIGSAGAHLTPLHAGADAVFAESSHGFAQFSIDGADAVLSIMDEDGKPEFVRAYHKDNKSKPALPKRVQPTLPK